MANASKNEGPSPSPLLIFVLGITNFDPGPPCSGKSTLCTTLSSRYNLDHFSLGAEMRQLISPNPSGPAAFIKPLFTPADIDTYKRCVTANELAPMHLSSRYVFERVFGIGATLGSTRVLVDGFPRDAARWEYFFNMLKEQGKWIAENGRAAVLVLSVGREVARKRYEKRGRQGDEFEKRFNEHEKNIGEIVEATKGDEVRVLEVDSNGEGAVDEMVMGLEEADGWRIMRTEQ